MTCAHVVHVALVKVNGVETVDVSLNRALAVIKLKSGNKVALSQLMKLIHEKGYTIKAATVSARGVPSKVQDHWVLKVSVSGETFELAPDPRKAAAYQELSRHAGETATAEGTMTPTKDLKNAVPLVISGLK